jgi:hypothetical protein
MANEAGARRLTGELVGVRPQSGKQEATRRTIKATLPRGKGPPVRDGLIGGSSGHWRTRSKNHPFHWKELLRHLVCRESASRRRRSAATT